MRILLPGFVFLLAVVGLTGCFDDPQQVCTSKTGWKTFEHHQYIADSFAVRDQFLERVRLRHGWKVDEMMTETLPAGSEHASYSIDSLLHSQVYQVHVSLFAGFIRHQSLCTPPSYSLGGFSWYALDSLNLESNGRLFYYLDFLPDGSPAPVLRFSYYENGEFQNAEGLREEYYVDTSGVLAITHETSPIPLSDPYLDSLIAPAEYTWIDSLLPPIYNWSKEYQVRGDGILFRGRHYFYTAQNFVQHCDQYQPPLARSGIEGCGRGPGSAPDSSLIRLSN